MKFIQREKEIIMDKDFINGNTRRSFFKMALPMTAAMFLNLAYNIVDSIWIGNLLGQQAMAALTVAMPVILLLTAVAMGAANGLTILLAQKIGAKEQTGPLVSTSFFLSAVIAVVITLLLELNLPAILVLLKTPTEIMKMAEDYLSLYLLGYLAVYLYLYFTAVLRSYGNTVLQAGAILLCTILNAVLDPIFISGMGFHGAAAATLLSQCTAVAILVVYLIRMKLFRCRFSEFKVSLVPGLFKVSLPAIIQQGLPAVSTSFLTVIVSSFGITVIAGYGIAGKLEMVLLFPAMAVNMVLTAIIGQCSGGKRPDRIRDYLKCAFGYGGIFVLALAVLITVFAKPLAGIFNSGEAAGLIVRRYFLIIGTGYVFNMLTNCLLGCINGIGKPIIGMVIMVFYYLIVRMPLAGLLARSGWGSDGVWTAVLISHVITFGAAVIAARVLMKEEFS